MPSLVNRAILLGAVLGFLLGLLVLISTSPGRPYGVINNGNEGLSKFASEFRTSWVTSLNSLSRDEASRTLLVIARTSELSRSEVDAIVSFLNSGGYVLAYGHQAFLESLLKHLNLSVNFSGRVLDPVFNAGSRHYIIANTSLCDGGPSIVVHAPFTTTQGFPRGNIIAWSSPLSFVDLNGNEYYDMMEPIGSFPIAIEVEYQQGKLIVMFTELLFENSILDYNKDLAKCISAGRLVVVDQSEARSNLIEYSKLALYGPRGAIYMAILVVLLLLVAYYVLQGK